MSIVALYTTDKEILLLAIAEWCEIKQAIPYLVCF